MFSKISFLNLYICNDTKTGMMTEYYVGDPAYALNRETLSQLRESLKTRNVVKDTFNGVYIQCYKYGCGFTEHLYGKNGNVLGFLDTYDGLIAVIPKNACDIKVDDGLYAIITSSIAPQLSCDAVDGIRIRFDNEVARIGE